MSNTWTGETIYSKDFTRLMRDVADLDLENPCITAAAADGFYFYFLDQYARKIYKVFKNSGTPIRTISLSDEPFMYQRSFSFVDNMHEADDYVTQACWADDSTGYFMGREEDMKLWHISRWTLHVLGSYLIVSEPVESTCWIYTKTGDLLHEFCIGPGGISGNGGDGHSRFAHVLAVEEEGEDQYLYVSHALYFGMRADDYSELSQYMFHPSITMRPVGDFNYLPGLYPTVEFSIGRGHHARYFWEVPAFPEPDGDDEWTRESMKLIPWPVPTFSKWKLNRDIGESGAVTFDPEEVAFEFNKYTGVLDGEGSSGSYWFDSHPPFNPTGGCIWGDALCVSAAGYMGLENTGGVFELDKDTLKIQGIRSYGSPRFGSDWGNLGSNEPWGNYERNAWLIAEMKGSDRHPGSRDGIYGWGQSNWNPEMELWTDVGHPVGGYEWATGFLWIPRVPDASVGCCLHANRANADPPPADAPILNVSNCGWVSQAFSVAPGDPPEWDGAVPQIPDVSFQMHFMWPSAFFTDGSKAYVIVNRLPWGDVLKNSSAIWGPIEGAIDPEDRSEWDLQQDGQMEVEECFMVSLDLTVPPGDAEWGNRTALKVRPYEPITWHKYFDTHKESVGTEPEDNDLAGSYVSVENLIELREGVERVISKHKTPIATYWPRYYYYPFQRDEHPEHWYPILDRPRTEAQEYVLGEVPDDVACDEWDYYEDGGPYTGWTETHRYETTAISTWLAWSTEWWANLGERINDEGQLEIAVALEFTGSADVTIHVQENLGPKRYASVYIGSSLNYVSIVQEAAPGFEDYPPCNQSAFRNAYYLAMADVETDYGLEAGTVTSTSTWRRPERSDVVNTPTYDIDIGELREIVDYLLARKDAESIMVIEPVADYEDEG